MHDMGNATIDLSAAKIQRNVREFYNAKRVVTVLLT